LPVRAVNEFVADPATRARLNGELAPLEAKRKALALKNTGGPWSQDDWEEYEKVLGEMTAVAKKILSPQELLDWEVRQQTPAVERLQRLPGFEFSGPEEFKAAYTIEREYRERSEKGEALAGLIAQRDAQLKALFGDARWKNYERSHDASFAAEVDLVSRHSLPTEYAAWLYDLREQFYDYERKLRDASGLSDDDRQGHLDEIRQKYRSFIAQYLSQPILDAYTESGGFWLRP
jgi:hypothetical protein